MIEALLDACEPGPREAALRRLRGGDVSALGRLERRLGTTVLLGLPPVARRGLTSLIKRLRVPRSWDVDALPLVALADARGIAPARGRAVLTHDLDWTECWEHLPHLADQEEAAGVRSCFHLLGRGPYRVEPRRLAELARRGFEIGSHGFTHDAYLGWRRPHEIRDALRAAVDALGVRVRTFRAPAMSFGPALPAVLEELGFTRDGSLPVFDVSRPGCGSIWPYRLPGGGLVELPLTVQDSELFRDRRLSDDEALVEVRRLASAVRARGGCFVFNGHPGILKEHPRFTAGLIEMFREDAAATPQEVELDTADAAR